MADVVPANDPALSNAYEYLLREGGLSDVLKIASDRLRDGKKQVTCDTDVMVTIIHIAQEAAAARELQSVPLKDMTLRDWFAGLALNGHLSTPEAFKDIHAIALRCAQTAPTAAILAYIIADEMLAEREDA